MFRLRAELGRMNYKYKLLSDLTVIDNKNITRSPVQRIVLLCFCFSFLCGLLFFSYMPSTELLFDKTSGYENSSKSRSSLLTTAAPKESFRVKDILLLNLSSESDRIKSTKTVAVFTIAPQVKSTERHFRTYNLSTKSNRINNSKSISVTSIEPNVQYTGSSNSGLLFTIAPTAKSTLTSAALNTTAPKTGYTVTSKASVHFRNPKYFVYSPFCRIPFVDPFAKEALEIYQPSSPAKCVTDNSEDIVTSMYDANKRHYSLHISASAAQKYVHSNITQDIEDPVRCCYSEVVRSGSGKSVDKSVKILPCTNFHQNFVVPLHITSMIVNCELRATNKTIQQFAFSFIHTRENSPKNSSQSTKVKQRRKPGVLLIGIDSLSRINLRRTMPNTFKYLQNNNWFELQGYNKVGDNTFPNLMAVLNGNNKSVADSTCKPTTVGGLDQCDLIWKSYKNFSYLTAYAEDTVSISTFNYLKVGFKNPPTDYYARPLYLAAEKTLTVLRKSLPFCIGRKQYGEYIYDYALEFARRFKGEPIFGLFWTNSFSHNLFDLPSSMDNRMVAYLKQFKSEGLSENSIIIFFSDHGMRFGPLQSISQAFLEERLPMFFISLPEWFKVEYGHYVEALKLNQNRLTSPYDFHMTLKHILEIFEPGIKLPQAPGCSSCQSFFKEMPVNRSCQDAGIPEHWCTCVPYESIKTNSLKVKKVTNLIIATINNYVKSKGFQSKCQALNLTSIEKAELKMEDSEEKFSSHRGNSTYKIVFITSPGEARFQATAVYNVNAEFIHVDIDDISRLNSYEKSAVCIDNKELKKFCICKGTR